jgi:hypothetical protein
MMISRTGQGYSVDKDGVWKRNKLVKQTVEYMTRCLEPGQDKILEEQLPWLGRLGGFWYVVSHGRDMVAHIAVVKVSDEEALIGEPFAFPWVDSAIKPLLASLATTRCKTLGLNVV